jgi:hypothetical protein
MTALRISPVGRSPGTMDVPRSKYPEIWKMYQEGASYDDIGVFAGVKHGAVPKILRRIKNDIR